MNLSKPLKKSPQTPTDADAPCWNTAEVARMTHVSVRQLQWWDERRIVKPVIIAHSRRYTMEQVESIAKMAELRKAGIQPSKFKKYLKWTFTSAVRIGVPTIINGVLVNPR